MQLTITIPDEFDAITLEAFGSPPMNQPIHAAPYVPTTKEGIEERLKNYVRGQVYAYMDNKALMETTRQRGEEIW